ncbi:hypothetical protein D3C75_1190490 [compost metagenome]
MRGMHMAGDDGADEPFLRLHTARIEVWIAAFPGLRCKGEEGKGHLKAVLRSCLQKRIDRPHHFF